MGWRLHPAKVFVAFCLLAASCGGTSTGTGSAASPSPSPSANPSASPTCVPASVTCVTFPLNGVNGSTAGGTIHLTSDPGAGSLTVELVIKGLQAGSSHISHVHVGSCSQTGGIAFALNQVIADAQGNADIKTTVPKTFPPPSGTTWYVVVHQGPDLQGSNAAYLMCGNLA